MCPKNKQKEKRKKQSVKLIDGVGKNLQGKREDDAVISERITATHTNLPMSCCYIQNSMV